MRATDVRLLRVQQIHDGIIDLAQSKTGSEQQWEITPAVQAILDEAASLPGRARSLYVLPTLRGNQALRWLEKAFQERSIFLTWLRTDPALDPVRSTSKFARLRHRVGLPE